MPIDLKVNHSGTWRSPSRGIQAHNGSWRQIRSVEVHDGSAWRTVFAVSMDDATLAGTSGAISSVNFYTDGRLILTFNGADNTTYWGWFSLVTANQYWVRATVTGSAVDVGSDPVDTWHNITTTRSWAYYTGGKSGTWVMEIATDSGGANIIAQATFTVSYA